MKTAKHRKKNRIEEGVVKVLMWISAVFVFGCLVWILASILYRGLAAVDLAMLTQTPKGGFYLGKEGGILNAIVGSLLLAGGATISAVVLGFPIALYLHFYEKRSRWADLIRLAMDVLYGVPSIVYGAFGFIIMLWLGLRASLLGGIITLAILELPIIVRGMDETIALFPSPLKEASFSLGATKLETATRIAVRQMVPGLLTVILLAFGRGIGDAASVLFTAGFSDRLPESLLSPVASLPLTVFFLLGTPFPTVQERAYAAAVVLTFVVLITSTLSRLFSRKFTRNVIR